MARVFFGIKPPVRILEQLEAMAWVHPDLYWQGVEQLHITVCFVGEVSDWRAKELLGQFESLRLEPFKVQLRGVGFFRGREDAIHLWAGVRPHNEITRLHREVKTKLSGSDIHVDHDEYRPHVTVARAGKEAVGQVSEFLGGNQYFATSEFLINEVEVFESASDRLSTRYKSLKSIPLIGESTD